MFKITKNTWQLCPKRSLPCVDNDKRSPSQAESALSEQVKERASEGKEVKTEMNLIERRKTETFGSIGLDFD